MVKAFDMGDMIYKQAEGIWLKIVKVPFTEDETPLCSLNCF